MSQTSDKWAAAREERRARRAADPAVQARRVRHEHEARREATRLASMGGQPEQGGLARWVANRGQ